MEIAAGSNVEANSLQVGRGVVIGWGVEIRCRQLCMGDDVTIGARAPADQHLGPVTIVADSLTVERGSVIEPGVCISGRSVHLGQQTTIRRGVRVMVAHLALAAEGVIGERSEISGRHLVLGRRLRVLPDVVIGGGSAFEPPSSLHVGDDCHIGRFCFINTARAVTLGNEVGLGTRTALYTHGAYLSYIDGYPVKFAPIMIGDNVWIPGATVNPGVTIGTGAVIAVGSVVVSDIPPYCLAGGVPARVIREDLYRQSPVPAEQVKRLQEVLDAYGLTLDRGWSANGNDGMWWCANLSQDVVLILLKTPHRIGEYHDGLGPPAPPCSRRLIVGLQVGGAPADTDTVFSVDRPRRLAGRCDKWSEHLANHLRRWGIRFRCSPAEGVYAPWD